MAELARKKNKRQKSYQEKHNPLPMSSVRNDYRNNSFLQYQKTMGNQAVQDLLNTGVIQPELKISSPNDKYEQEADRIAEKIINMPQTSAHENNNPIMINPKAEGLQSEETKVPQHFKTVTNSIKAQGRPLPQSARTSFEPYFGDLSHIRLYTDDKAAKAAETINAKAFTLGNNIIFAAGQYALQDQSGRRLLAHELVHAIQQGLHHKDRRHWMSTIMRAPNSVRGPRKSLVDQEVLEPIIQEV